MKSRSANSSSIWILITLLGIGALAILAIFTFIDSSAQDVSSQSANVSNTGQTTQSNPDQSAGTAYLDREEMVKVTTTSSGSSTTTERSVEQTGVKYIEITDSCDHTWQGRCVAAYDSPSSAGATTSRLRQGMVLRVDGEIQNEERTWYRLEFDDQHLLYPERITSDWFVAADEVEVLYAPGVRTSWEDQTPSTTNKRIVVDKSEQMLYAYEGDTLYLETPVSTGLELSPTTLGTFTVFKKTPSRYMQGPLEGMPESEDYDLSGVPWNLYFTEDGAVIHGTYWHDSFGQKYSHGCVNIRPDIAETLYEWTPLTTTVIVQN